MTLDFISQHQGCIPPKPLMRRLEEINSKILFVGKKFLTVITWTTVHALIRLPELKMFGMTRPIDNSIKRSQFLFGPTFPLTRLHSSMNLSQSSQWSRLNLWVHISTEARQKRNICYLHREKCHNQKEDITLT